MNIIILPEGNFQPDNSLPFLVKAFEKEGFLVKWFLWDNPPSFKDDLLRASGHLKLGEPSILLAIGRGGYLAFNLLKGLQNFTAVIICCAPYDLRKWPQLSKLSNEWKAYFKSNPAELAPFTNLPPTLLLYGKDDKVVGWEQGMLAYMGLSTTFQPGLPKPSVRLIGVSRGAHNLAYEQETIESIIFWLSKLLPRQKGGMK